MDSGRWKGRFKNYDAFSNPIKNRFNYNSQKNDHKILNTALLLKESLSSYQVIMVTKDINLRKRLRLLPKAEDYQTGKVENTNNLEVQLL